MKDLNEKGKEIQRKYLKEWRRKNPEKVKEYNDRYWAKKAEKAEREGRGA